MKKTWFKGIEIGININSSYDFFFQHRLYTEVSLKAAVKTLAHLMGISCVIR